MDANAIVLKVTQLLVLAGNTGASEEEARTAAITAAKLIKTHGLVVVAKSAPAPKAAPAPKSSYAYQKPPAATPYKVVITKVFCACKKCGKTIKPGEKVSVKVGNLMTMKGARHVACV